MPLRKAGPAAVVAALACGSLLMAQDPADSHLTLRISAGRITVGTSARDGEALRDEGAGQGVALVCREFRLSAASRKPAILECADVVLVTASGVEGRAKRLRYDSGRQRITLSGSDEQAVELIHESDAEDRPSTRLSAQRVVIDLGHLRIMAEGARAVVECQSKPDK